MSFRLKTVLGIAAIEAVLLAILIGSSLRFLASSNQERLLQHAATTATLFATTTKNAVLATDLASLESFVSEVLRNPGLIYARVIGDGVELAAGGDPAALARRFVADRDLETVTDGVFDTFAPIRGGGRDYGRVEVGLATDRVTAVMAEARQRIIAIAVVEILLTALFSLGLGLYLTRQLKDLRQATRELAEGRLHHRIPVRGQDELADTARAFNDMSGHLEAQEQALVRARDQAQRASAAKSEFLSRMSHELRTPMNAILGFAQLLETDPDEPLTVNQQDAVQEILHAGQHLLELINEVLDLSRIESGRLTIAVEPVDLEAVVVAALALVQTQAAARGIRLLPAARETSWEVRADRTRLRQILLNLLSNAIKYNHPRGTVRLAVDSSDPARLTLTVTDTGPGLTPAQQATVFEPFTRHHEDSGAEGTGIGLSISRRLARLMGGDLTVTSTPGQGSCFALHLTRATPGANPDRTAVPPGAGS
jgi:signal transduction histidine kinase